MCTRSCNRALVVQDTGMARQRILVILALVLAFFRVANAQNGPLLSTLQRAEVLLEEEQIDRLTTLADSLRGSSVADPRILGDVLMARIVMRTGDRIKAYKAVERLLETDAPRDSVVLFAATYAQALALHGMKLSDEAIAKGSQALTIARACHIDHFSAKALVLLADIENSQDRYDRALGHLLEAERLCALPGGEGERCAVLLGRGNVLYHQDRYVEAIAEYEAGADCALVTGRTRQWRKAVFNIGSAKYMAGDASSAISYYRKVLSSSPRSHDQRLVAEVHSQIGLLLSEEGSFEEALGELTTALGSYRELGDRAGQADGQLYLARALQGSGRSDDAIAAAEQALALADSTGSLRRRADCTDLLAELQEIKGRTSLALALTREAYMLRDSLAEQKRGENVARIEIAHETEKKEQTIRLQGIEIDRTTAKAAAAAAQRNIVIGALVAAMILGGLVYRNVRQKQLLAEQGRVISEHRVEQVLRDQELRVVDAVMQGQEQERARVAKDLHDRVGMLLSAVKMQFGALEGRIERVQATAGEQYQKVTDLLDTAVGEVRRISHDMEHGNLATFGLATALEDLRDAVHVPGKLEVELNTFGLGERLDKRLEVATYRMVQEAVSNALKHAKASHLSIQATRSETLLNLMVEDDGLGFDPANAGDGMGMSNLRARAAEFNGAVRVDSLPGRGTTVVIDLPIPQKAP